MMQMKKGHFDSKTGGNGFQKTESELWGLPLMNGGLKNIDNPVMDLIVIRHRMLIYIQ